MKRFVVCGIFMALGASEFKSPDGAKMYFRISTRSERIIKMQKRPPSYIEDMFFFLCVQNIQEPKASYLITMTGYHGQGNK